MKSVYFDFCLLARCEWCDTGIETGAKVNLTQPHDTSAYFRNYCQEEKYVYNDSRHCWEMQRCCFLSDYYSVLWCNFPKSYFVLITGSKSEPMRVGSVGIVLVFMPCEFDSTITATPLSKCISPETERLNIILEYSRGKTEFINIF